MRAYFQTEIRTLNPTSNLRLICLQLLTLIQENSYLQGNVLYTEVNLFKKVSWYDYLMVSIFYVCSNIPIATYYVIFWDGSITVFCQNPSCQLLLFKEF